MKSRLFVAILLICALSAACSEESHRPNVFLIVIDGLRADHMGAYGYPQRTTPMIDFLAMNGARFDRAYASAPWSLPTLATILTGRYPSEHEVVTETSYIKKNGKTLPGALKHLGYMTAGIVSNPFAGKERGFGEDFDFYYHARSEPAEKIAERAVSWIEAHRKSPFFLMLQFSDPLPPYAPPTRSVVKHYPKDVPPLRGGALEIIGILDHWPAEAAKTGVRALSGLYDAEIDYTDEALGTLYKHLQQRRFDRNSIVIVTSTHGEAFMEHGLMSHGTGLYDEQIRVPLIIYAPQNIRSPLVVRENVGSADLYPTIVELAGGGKAEGPSGRSLFPLISKTPEAGAAAPFKTRAVFSETTRYGPDRFCVIEGSKKYHYSPVFSLNGCAFGPRLYDMDNDPQEKKDLPAADAALAAHFEELIAASDLFQRRKLYSVLFGKAGAPSVYSGTISSAGRFLFLYKHSIHFGLEQGNVVLKDFAVFRKEGVIRFAAVADKDANGFHFALDPPDALVHATLLENGAKHPDRIAVGSAGEHPSAMPFIISEAAKDASLHGSLPGYTISTEEVWTSKAASAKTEIGEYLPPSAEFIKRLRSLIKSSDGDVETTLKAYLTAQGEEPLPAAE